MQVADFWKDIMLLQAFQPMAAQLSLKSHDGIGLNI